MSFLDTFSFRKGEKPSLFKMLFSLVPPTSNSTSGKTKDLLKRKVKNTLADHDFPSFGEESVLFSRVYFFNHETCNTRDIHNIIKPLMDSLENHVYKNDRQVVHFEGIRLDMEHSNRLFEIEFHDVPMDDMESMLSETCCYIEICPLPLSGNSEIKVKWL